MGISIEQHRLAIGLHLSRCSTRTTYLHSIRVLVENEITISLSFLTLSVIILLLNGFLCARHIIIFLCKFIMSAMDVHPNPGPTYPSSNNVLKVCHSNVRSIKSAGKLEEIQMLAQSENFKVITISETWLDADYPDQLLAIDNFQPPFRRDRQTGRGGGVLTYVHSSLPCTRRADLEGQNCECIWVEISTPLGALFVGNYYRPPGQPAEIRDAFLESLATSIHTVLESNPYTLIITGDFNDRCADWNSAHPDSELGTSLVNLVASHNLFQLIEEPTRISEYTSNLLDLIITDSPGLVLDSGVLTPISNSDHSVIFCSLSLTHFKDKSFKRPIWDFNKANFQDLNIALSSAPWDTAHEVYDSLDDIVSYWSDLFLSTAKDFIPYREVTIRPQDKPWITTEIKKRIRKRNRAWKRFKRYSNTPRPYSFDMHLKIEKFYRFYKKSRNMVVNKIRQSMRSYFLKLNHKLDEKDLNPKQWWKLSKSVLGNKIHPDIPPLIDNNNVISCITEKCDIFNTYFASQCKILPDLDAPPLPNFSFRTDARLHNISVNEDDVKNVLSSLRLSSASGPDNIGNILLKNSAVSISKSLTKLFTQSLNQSYFPNSWKRSNVCPVFKKSNRQLKSNYRPISLLCNVSKVFERLVFNALYEYLTYHNLLTPKNSGFKADDSTINQLVYILHNIYNGLELSKETRMVFLDVSKAFDKVWHPGLLFKLKQLGISDNLTSWVESYLSNRFQRVVIHGQTSSWLPVEAGVPQGSILGPLLFLVYVNDLVDNLTCDARLFADDTCLLELVNTPAESSHHLNTNLFSIWNWGKLWRVIFNALKSLSVVFSAKRPKPHHPPLVLGESRIPEGDIHTHLGITLSSNLSWRAHITRITNKASQRIALLRRFKHRLSRKTLVRLYLSLVRPILEYGCVLFDNCGQGLSDLLESIQFEAAKICTGALRHTSRVKLLQELGWPTLANRRKYFKLVLFYKMHHKLTPSYLSDLLPPTFPGRVLRHTGNIRRAKCRTQRMENSFVPDAIKQWNNLPSDIRDSISLQVFKSKLKKTLLAVDIVPSYYSHGNRFPNICHTQLRLGFSKLNFDLYKVNILSHPTCLCTHPCEDLTHFLLFCPLYSHSRKKLLDTITSILAPGAHMHHKLLVDIACERLIEIMLFGSTDLPDAINVQIFDAVQLYIVSTRRFVY